MPEIGRWNGHRFEVTPSVIRGFTGLQVKGSSETEDKTKSKQKYVARKNGKPAEVSLTINLNAMLGCNVRAEAMAFIADAEAGKKDYFYVGNAKLLTCKLMLVDASVKEIDIAAGSVWRKADVALTMKQCSKFGAITTGSSGSGKKKKSKKKSVRRSSRKTTRKYGTGKKKATHSSRSSGIDAITGAAPIANKQTVKSVNAGIRKATSIAKKNRLNAQKKSGVKAIQ